MLVLGQCIGDNCAITLPWYMRAYNAGPDAYWLVIISSIISSSSGSDVLYVKQHKTVNYSVQNKVYIWVSWVY